MPPRPDSHLAPAPAAYLLLGDESFFRDQFRARALARSDALIVAADLREDALDDLLDQARTPSLLDPRRIFWIRGVKELYGRGKRGGDFPANLKAYVAKHGELTRAGAAPEATLVFIADHLHIPSDRRRMNWEDRPRLERIEETLAPLCEVISCAQVEPERAVQELRAYASQRNWRLRQAAAELLVELTDANLGLAARELEKLALFAANGESNHAAGGESKNAADGEKIAAEITTAAVAELVAGQHHRSVLDLTEALAERSRPAALAALVGLFAAEGDNAAIPLLFQLSRNLNMALFANERRVSDRSQLYQVLPPGLKPPTTAADAILRLARRSRHDLAAGIERLQRLDVALRSQPLSTAWLFEEWALFMTAPSPIPTNPQKVGDFAHASAK